MLTILISTLTAIGVPLLLGLTGAVGSKLSLVFLGILLAVVLVIVLLRQSSKRLDPLMKEVEKHLAGGRVELALKTLESGYELKKWNPLVPANLNASIGTIHFDRGDSEKAETYLAKAIRYPWQTRAFLGVLYFRKREEQKMVKAFETAVSVGAKDPLSWTLYAWCMQARGKKDETVKILERALKKLPKDERLKGNLELAQEGKKLKTAPYGDKWSRFRVDGSTPTANLPREVRGYNPRPGFRQRPQRRK